eukprot:CFRG2254T1
MAIPVILDTDIGTDVDDVWALLMLLKSPEVSIKLITTATENTTYRAALVAKFLGIAERSDIPIGIGVAQKAGDQNHSEWLKDYSIEEYTGEVMADGVGALVDVIMKSDTTVTVICIGPLTNIAEALRRQPGIAHKCKLVAMFGSLRVGYRGGVSPEPEYNVYKDIKACQRILKAEWSIKITPLDTCGDIMLTGDNFQLLRNCQDPLVQATLDLYSIWLDKFRHNSSKYKHLDPHKESSILFDCVAVYLAYSDEHMHIEDLGVYVTDNGLTCIDEKARTVQCAISWKDRAAFLHSLAKRLIAPTILKSSI